jgi:DNA-directed RNA polymerase subunit RPC12/RpoP
VLDDRGVKQKSGSTFAVSDSSGIVAALVGLKNVRVLRYVRRGRNVELVIEQAVDDLRCPGCGGKARVKERLLVRYVVLAVYGTRMRLEWRKHRMCCMNLECPKRTWVLGDHRIAEKGCLLTTRMAKWATLQVGTGRTVKKVAGELGL